MGKWSLLALLALMACSVGGSGVVLSGGGDIAEEPGLGAGNGTDPPVGLGHEGFALLLNDTRVEGGVSVLVEHHLLTQAAAAHAQDMTDNDYLSHTDLNGGRAGDRALAVGYDWDFIAENIARGFRSDEAVMQAWMDSPGHADNILDHRAEEFGIGRVNDTWVLLLGSRFEPVEPAAATP